MLKTRECYFNESSYAGSVFEHYSTCKDYVIDSRARTFVRFVSGNDNTPSYSNNVQSMMLFTKSARPKRYNRSQCPDIIKGIEDILANPKVKAEIPEFGKWEPAATGLVSKIQHTLNDWIVSSFNTYSDNRTIRSDESGLVYLTRLLNAFKAFVTGDLSNLNFDEYTLNGFTFVPFTWPGVSNREVYSIHGFTKPDVKDISVHLRMDKMSLCTSRARGSDMNGIQAMHRLLRVVATEQGKFPKFDDEYDIVAKPEYIAARGTFSEYVRVTAVQDPSKRGAIKSNLARIIINCDQVANVSKVVFFSSDAAIKSMCAAMINFEAAAMKSPQ